MYLEKGGIKMRMLNPPNKKGSGFEEESRIGGERRSAEDKDNR